MPWCAECPPKTAPLRDVKDGGVVGVAAQLGRVEGRARNEQLELGPERWLRRRRLRLRYTASASAAVRLRHDHRPFSTDWRVLVGGVCSVATTELRLFVRVWLWCVRTGTGLKRRLLVWCERLSCLSESVVVTCIIVRVVEEQWRVWPKACVAFRVHTTEDAKHDSYTMRSNHAATEPVQVAVTALSIERNQRPAQSPVAAL
jgi:hypothetical protein